MLTEVAMISEEKGWLGILYNKSRSSGFVHFFKKRIL